MKLETFSYLPAMTEEQVRRQVEYVLRQGLVPAIEFTASPRLDLTYWTMWDLPMADLRGSGDVGAVMKELAACRTAHPDAYVKVVGYDPVRQCQVVSFVAYRPAAAA